MEHTIFFLAVYGVIVLMIVFAVGVNVSIIAGFWVIIRAACKKWLS